MTEQLITTIIAVVLIIGAGLLVYFKYKNSPKEEDKQAAKEFLNGLRDIIYNDCIKFIKNFDYDKYDNLGDIEINLINDLITNCKSFISNELEKSADILSVLSIKCLNSDFIEKFIFDILDDINIFEKIDKETNVKYINENVDEDEELIKEFSDTSKYNEKEMEKLPEAEEIKYSEEELAKLNPQVDEEEKYNPNDESMELIDTEETEELKKIVDTDDIYIDATGRAHSTSTGKFVKRV